MVPSWDLVVVLEAMCEPPFEPLEALDLRILSYKTALLLALALSKHVGDLNALPVHPTCIHFALDGPRVVLRPIYKPKVLSGEYSALSVELPALSNLSIDSEEDRKLHVLCGLYAGTLSRCGRCIPLINCLYVLLARFGGSRYLSSVFHTELWRPFLWHTRAMGCPCLLGWACTQLGAWQRHGLCLGECLWRKSVRPLAGRRAHVYSFLPTGCHCSDSGSVCAHRSSLEPGAVAPMRSMGYVMLLLHYI